MATFWHEPATLPQSASPAQAAPVLVPPQHWLAGPAGAVQDAAGPAKGPRVSVLVPEEEKSMEKPLGISPPGTLKLFPPPM